MIHSRTQLSHLSLYKLKVVFVPTVGTEEAPKRLNTETADQQSEGLFSVSI